MVRYFSVSFGISSFSAIVWINEDISAAWIEVGSVSSLW